MMAIMSTEKNDGEQSVAGLWPFCSISIIYHHTVRSPITCPVFSCSRIKSRMIKIIILFNRLHAIFRHDSVENFRLT